MAEREQKRRLGPRKKARLDDKFVRRMSVEEHAGQTWWDSEQRGFGVYVSNSGLKSFIVAYRVDLRERRFTIGSYPAWGVAAAREEAGRIRQRADRGIDHIAEEQLARHERIKRHSLTLKVALKETVEDKNRALRERSKLSYKHPVESYLGDWLDSPLCDITGDDVLGRFEEIRDGRNLADRKDRGRFAEKDGGGVGRRTLKGGESSAKATMTALRAIWKYADWRHPHLGLGDPPTRRLPKGWSRIVERDRVIPESKLSAFVEACRCYHNQTEGDLALLLLFTGLRLSEGAALRWSEIDIENGILKLSAERMKGKKSLTIPLNGLAMEVLRGRFKEDTKKDAFVFPGRAVRNKMDHATITGRFKKYLDEAVGTHTSPHDWRRSFTTIALAEVPLHAVEVLTGHVSSGPVTLSAYYKPSMSDLRKSCRKIEKSLRQLIYKDGGKVIFFPA